MTDESTDSTAADADTDAAHSVWCGRCGKGFETERGAKIHCGRTHGKTDVRHEAPDPDLQCDDCGRVYTMRTDLTTHTKKSLCGAALPDDITPAEFETIVTEADTMLEVQRALRDQTRLQTKQLLDDHDLLDEVETADARSPQQLVDSLGLDDDAEVDHPDGDESWQAYYQETTND